MSASGGQMGAPYLDQDALYYPYTRIRDVEWLQRTLLLFPHVARIVPAGLKPADDPGVLPFVTTKARRGELLKRANVYSKRMDEERRRLKQRFEEEIARDLASLQLRFGFEATARIKQEDPFGVQIHIDKAKDILELLKKHDLAWTPRKLEPHYPDEYYEVHPRIGEAIMTTLAVTCAEEEGFQIVTGNGKLHRCLAQHDLDGTFRTWIQSENEDAWNQSSPPEHRLALAIFEQIDTTKLTAENLSALSKEWEPRGRLLLALRNLSETIPKISNKARLQERTQDLATER